LKNVDLLNLPILNQSDISNLNSQKINSKNNVNSYISSRKLKS